MNKTKVVRLHSDVIEEMEKIGGFGESYNDVIIKLLVSFLK